MVPPTPLRRPRGPGPASDPVFGPLSNWTGWSRIGGEIAPGNYDIYILVGDAVDTLATSAFFVDDIQLNVIPEPATLALFGLGLVGVGVVVRRRRRRAA